MRHFSDILVSKQEVRTPMWLKVVDVSTMLLTRAALITVLGMAIQHYIVLITG
jgi:hypothetical protein